MRATLRSTGFNGPQPDEGCSKGQRSHSDRAALLPKGDCHMLTS